MNYTPHNCGDYFNFSPHWKAGVQGDVLRNILTSINRIIIHLINYRAEVAEY